MDNLTKAITELALDTENAEKNYTLALEYESIGQTASAINYFFRAAERTNSKELAYECLLKKALCWERQGNRQHTVRRVLQHALYLRPKRPEAYFLMSRILERTQQYVDGYTFASIGLQICDFDLPPLRSDVEYPGMYGLMFEKAICGWYWGKNKEAKNILLELSGKYKDQLDDKHKSAVEYNLSNLKSGFGKNPGGLNAPSNKKKTIVDFFAYYDDTCKELLELRIKLLNDYVDYFVICESNKTHSGIPIQYKLRERIKEYNLPEEKIIIIDLDIPEPEDLIVLEVDLHNSGSNRQNINSVRARVRERMQKDAILSVLDRFDDNTIIIHSDCDEIIDPNAIKFVTDIASTLSKQVIKVPLVYLEGQADLRVYDSLSGNPKEWNLSMFICTKKHLVMTTPTNIRCNYNNPFEIVWCTHAGKVCQDLGWHFSWMGGKEKRKIKRDAFCHYEDSYDFLETKSYNNKEAIEFLEKEPTEGSIPPSLESNTVLKKYDVSKLPEMVFNLPRIKNFLFGKTKSLKFLSDKTI